ncbi:MAG: 4'-phosphopantetheinyl transferase superfamily protein [Bryobacteraceae bacterium]
MHPGVEVSVCSLEQAGELAGRYLPLLSADEVERAGRFKLDHLRHAYILGRGMTRLILARRIDVDPRAIRFQYSTYGKPSLEGAQGWHFNASNTRSLLVCALTEAAPIGVDIEQVRPMPDACDIAERFFSAAEAQRVLSAPPESVATLFFEIWTRKEAFLKATGTGLSRDLHGFTVSAGTGEIPRLEHIEKPDDDPALWSLRAFVPAESYVGALAVRAPIGEVSLRTINPGAVQL